MTQYFNIMKPTVEDHSEPWISTNDQLPDNTNIVLVAHERVTGQYVRSIAYYARNTNEWLGTSIGARGTPQYWTELPVPPRK